MNEVEIFYYVNGYFDRAALGVDPADSHPWYKMGWEDADGDTLRGNSITMAANAAPFLSKPDGTIILCVEWLGNDKVTGLPGTTIYLVDAEPEADIEKMGKFKVNRYVRTGSGWLQK